MDDIELKHRKMNAFQRWLPYAVAMLGILLSLGIWYSTIAQEPLRFLPAIEESYPWVIFALGISLSLVMGLAIRLVQLTLSSKKSYDEIYASFKKQINERLEAEETRQKLEKAMLQGQKLQAIGTLAGGIAHDFNNLLYAIIGYVEMAKEDVPKDSIVYKNLGKVIEASERGQELISRILSFSRRQHHTLKPLSLKNTIDGVLGLLLPTIPASVNVIFNAEPGDYTVLGNQTQLHQVLVNIINNAVDAMDGEGTVTIHLSKISSNDESLFDFPRITEGNYCKINITDTGHGMDQATMGRIFEPFYTTKEVGKGTGLGLATVHSIMTEHKGEVLVQSTLGQGSTFTLLLPEYKETKDGENTTG